MIVVMNVVRAAEGRAADFERAFANRERRLAEVPGFAGFELLRRQGENEYLVISRWESREAFEGWRRSDAFKAAHAGDGGRGELSHGNEIRTYDVLELELPA